jgi:hypothetical protein
MLKISVSIYHVGFVSKFYVNVHIQGGNLPTEGSYIVINIVIKYTSFYKSISVCTYISTYDGGGKAVLCAYRVLEGCPAW